MEVVRLGKDVDRTRRLSAAAIDRARIVLADYAKQIDTWGVDRIRMVATSASRDAENAEEFRSMVHATLGIFPDVISGDEEANLAFAGAVATLTSDVPDPVLVVDIGGGSTEFVVGLRACAGLPARVLKAISVNMGCVRVTERHLTADPPTAASVLAAREEITETVDRALRAVDAQSARTLIGLAGSVTTVVGIALGLNSYQPKVLHHARVGYPAIVTATDQLLGATRAARMAIPVMHPERADVIGAGALIMRTILERAGFDEILASEHDILDGIAWSLA